jgi:nicotinate-nucleotide adenylyltransferase
MLTDYTVVFGGSFDPPHAGHQAIISWLIDSLDAKEVKVCPTFEHCFGKKMESFISRAHMCHAMVSDIKRAGAYIVEASMPRPNLTKNLLKHFKDSGIEKLAVVIGADNLNQIHKWNGWDEVVKLAKVVAVGRPGYEMEESYPFDVDIYPVGISTISSTEIRKRLIESKSLEGFVPMKVAEYIKENGLYQCQQS